MMKKFLPGLLVLVLASIGSRAQAQGVDASFRGCSAAGWCQFALARGAELPGGLVRVRPDGVAVAPGNALRDRLNALLADMIHQHKHIELRDLRRVDADLYAARVLVHGIDIGTDAELLNMR
jgi:hypothetical protein